jgi:hypothetical protein
MPVSIASRSNGLPARGESAALLVNLKDFWCNP